jgi:hypothetical protein
VTGKTRSKRFPTYDSTSTFLSRKATWWRASSTSTAHSVHRCNKRHHGLRRQPDAAPDSDGTVIMDSNRATNLPCAYTEFATCQLRPATASQSPSRSASRSPTKRRPGSVLQSYPAVVRKGKRLIANGSGWLSQAITIRQMTVAAAGQPDTDRVLAGPRHRSAGNESGAGSAATYGRSCLVCSYQLRAHGERC